MAEYAKDFPFTEDQIKWIEALELGNFSQTHKHLNCREHEDEFGQTYPAGFCCLGVCAEVMEWPKQYDEEQNCTSYVHPETLKLEGVTEHDAHLFWQSAAFSDEMLTQMGLSRKGAVRLMTMNDSQCLSFREIAKRLKEDPHTYFGDLEDGKDDSD